MQYSVDPIAIFKHASPVVKLVMLVLTALSFATLAVAFYKTFQFLTVERLGRRFISSYRNTRDKTTLYSQWKPNAFLAPEIELFISFFSRWKRGESLQTLNKTLVAAREECKNRLRRFLTFLATTASAAPFIGLFGTVWGIMDAFFRIGQMKSVGLPVVAPAIAEALIATALGLLAAIPASIAYNYLLSWQKKLMERYIRFAEEWLTELKTMDSLREEEGGHGLHESSHW